MEYIFFFCEKKKEREKMRLFFSSFPPHVIIIVLVYFDTKRFFLYQIRFDYFYSFHLLSPRSPLSLVNLLLLLFVWDEQSFKKRKEMVIIQLMNVSFSKCIPITQKLLLLNYCFFLFLLSFSLSVFFPIFLNCL